MKIKSINIKNFRLLRNVDISLEDNSTVIVGRNNSGKTSLTEIFRKLLSDRTPTFSLYDFNIGSIDRFKNALHEYILDAEQDVIREILPFIEITFVINYQVDIVDFGVLGDFIINLDPACNDVLIVVRYQLQNGKMDALFDGILDETEPNIVLFLKGLKDKIPSLFEVVVYAQDPNDPTNKVIMEYSKFRQVIGAGFINAQRGLDDITHTEKDVLGKVLAKLFKTANSPLAPEDMREHAEALDNVVKDIQHKVDVDFNEKLNDLLPALQIFGYPGLVDPQLSTETTLDVNNILDSHTKIRYSQGNGLFLPETYNGLGSRNLIYILFQLFEFFRDWQSMPVTNGIYIVFIEEPEAHLHPQMQQVFIKQLDQIASEFSRTLNNNVLWPVQFIVTTHSTHIANEAKFESIRYFLTERNQLKETRIKDLGLEFSAAEVQADKEFLHKYLTLTKCDLFFADKAILIEGTTERILMPVLIEKVDAIDDGSPKLSSQYITCVEIGGAYAHHFYKFLDFLELKTVIITDLDSALATHNGTKTVYTTNEVSLSSHSTNAGIKNWFDKDAEGYMAIGDCINKTSEEKINNFRRIAYQIPETNTTCCARSFEDALMLANIDLFGITGNTDQERATDAFNKAPSNKEKTDFSLKYALEELNWVPPQYIFEALKWLSQNPVIPVEEPAVPVVNEENAIEAVEILNVANETDI